jgi:aminoglycoside 2'-N-acetyltransferase I
MFPMYISLTQFAEQSEEELAALRILSNAVYPPEVVASLPGREIEWSPRQWSVIVWNDDHTEALGHAKIVIRLGRHNEQDLRIGGIGGVMTHPVHRRQGCASAALARCIEFFREDTEIDLGLLVCEPTLLPFYSRRGWRQFSGKLLVTQKGKTEEFTFNNTMTFPIRRQDDPSGIIDLLGPPW